MWHLHNLREREAAFAPGVQMRTAFVQRKRMRSMLLSAVLAIVIVALTYLIMRVLSLENRVHTVERLRQLEEMDNMYGGAEEAPACDDGVCVLPAQLQGFHADVLMPAHFPPEDVPDPRVEEEAAGEEEEEEDREEETPVEPPAEATMVVDAEATMVVDSHDEEEEEAPPVVVEPPPPPPVQPRRKLRTAKGAP